MAGRDRRRFEEGDQLAVGMEVPGTEGYGAFAVADQAAGCGADRGQPIGDVLRIPDRGGQQQQFCL